ncbi:ribonuclease H family protein [Bacillus cereus]|uniref:ribonuclease H family protein n=1 Tax=Bacillus cereus TaxID=1396 RepID=UPI003079715D
MYICHCDASYNESEKTGSMGLVVFDSDNQVCLKQSKKLGQNIVTSLHAELLALNESLLVLKSMNMKDVLVNIDQRGIVNKINESKYLKSKHKEVYKPIMDEITYNLQSLEAELAWVHRNKNKIADKLSR